MTSNERRDILTGWYSSHPELVGKKFPVTARSLAVLDGPCTLCERIEREVRDDGPVVVIPNLWSPFGADGQGDLVLSRRHALSLEDLGDEELAAFFTRWVELRREYVARGDKTFSIMNVGREAGSSQPHLHSQVVSVVSEAVAPIRLDANREALAKDLEKAREHGLVIFEGEGVVAYAPWAPTTTGEVRVIAEDAAGLGQGVRGVVRQVNAAFGERSYNVVLHDGAAVVAQVLTYFTAPGMLPTYSGISIITVAPERLAGALREKE